MIPSPAFDPFGGFPLEARIVSRAADCGIELSEAATAALAAHARAVLRSNEELHLTSITRPEEFLERHLGEGFEGAAMLDAGIEGPLLDLGSGNGYPGLVLAAARPGLVLWMAEASSRKAAFQRAVLREIAFTRALVIETQVQRASDIDDLGRVRAISCRAVGGWAKILPRLTACLVDEGEMLLWAGEEVEAIARRVVWQRLQVVERQALPGRSHSWIWRLRRTGPQGAKSSTLA